MPSSLSQQLNYLNSFISLFFPVSESMVTCQVILSLYALTPCCFLHWTLWLDQTSQEILYNLLFLAQISTNTHYSLLHASHVLEPTDQYCPHSNSIFLIIFLLQNFLRCVLSSSMVAGIILSGSQVSLGMWCDYVGHQVMFRGSCCCGVNLINYIC